MTLCGWKIFSKNKRVKHAKNNETTTSSSGTLSVVQQQEQQQQLNLPSSSSESSTSAVNVTGLIEKPSTLFEKPSQLFNINNVLTLSNVPLTKNNKKNQIIKRKIKSTMITAKSTNNLEKNTVARCTDDIDINNKRKIKQKQLSKSDTEDDDKNRIDGNPRNKCALKPGHSLIDWIRLGSSGCDLAGTKGIIRPVSPSELQLHCKKDDAWLSIRGKVYNVTRYMDFHPGGSEELMKGIGKDATKMFDEVHAWVNYEQLLSKCYIGPLQNIVTIDLEPNTFRKSHQRTSLASDGNNKSIPSVPLFAGSSSAKTSPTKLDTTNINNSGSSDEINSPRFDWIQKTSELILIFYTKPFCNPGIIIINENECNLNVKILIERRTFLYNFNLLKAIKWPAFIKLHSETGKIEIILGKNQSELWINYGKMEKENFINCDDCNLSYEIIENQKLTHDSYAICLKSRDNIIMLTPIGYHVSVTALINDMFVTRSYTPVPVNYLPMKCPNECISFLIKTYSTGKLANYLTSFSNENINSSSSSSLTTPTSVSRCNGLNLSQPKGNFVLKKLLDHCRIGLLAAGSGITPMLSLLNHLLERHSNRIENIQFLFFNKTEKDIWCRQQLELIAEKDKRFVIRYILSEPDTNWSGEIGRISEILIAPLNDTKTTSYVTYCCVCGPTQFNDLSQTIFNKIGFQSTNLHFFQG